MDSDSPGIQSWGRGIGLGAGPYVSSASLSGEVESLWLASPKEVTSEPRGRLL